MLYGYSCMPALCDRQAVSAAVRFAVSTGTSMMRRAPQALALGRTTRSPYLCWSRLLVLCPIVFISYILLFSEQ
ncbi:hypothetical protein OE88DRAFT_1194737 [Heliocybe sulcata]|uniref:Uncharacterized protein n=1 Tax=Heliocybe sulcata TaxID=5364 RepID=A0A5C3NLD3_9AGAM|nr:hypothetical protein OE88DRAFT_1194737 [Heliocybe sulcata]